MDQNIIQQYINVVRNSLELVDKKLSIVINSYPILENNVIIVQISVTKFDESRDIHNFYYALSQALSKIRSSKMQNMLRGQDTSDVVFHKTFIEINDFEVIIFKPIFDEHMTYDMAINDAIQISKESKFFKRIDGPLYKIKQFLKYG